MNDYDEIIVIGSGKGVVSVSSIEKPFWKRKSLKNYRNLSKIYQLAVTNCPRYNGWSIIVSVLKTTDRGRKFITMFSINPFSILAETVSPVFMQLFVIVMTILVVVGTLVDIIHKKMLNIFLTMQKKLNYQLLKL